MQRYYPKELLAWTKYDQYVRGCLSAAVVEQLVCHWTLMQQDSGSDLTEDRYLFLHYYEFDGAPVFNMYMPLPLQHITGNDSNEIHHHRATNNQGGFDDPCIFYFLIHYQLLNVLQQQRIRHSVQYFVKIY